MKFLALLVLFAAAVAAPADRRLELDGKFRQLMSTRQRTKADVLRIVGPPDDVWRDGDPASLLRDRDEIWCYGTDRHLGMPTLGIVEFLHGRALTNCADVPPERSGLDEDELVHALRSMWVVPTSTNWSDWPKDPLFLIKANNALAPLGPEKALVVMREARRVCPWTNCYYVAHMLWRGGSGERDLPDAGFPIACRWSEGSADDIGDFTKGSFHPGPPRFEAIRPPDNPFAALLDMRRHSPSVDLADRLLQAADMVRRVYAPAAPGCESIRELPRYAAEFDAIGAKWDAMKQEYVARDPSGGWRYSRRRTCSIVLNANLRLEARYWTTSAGGLHVEPMVYGKPGSTFTSLRITVTEGGVSRTDALAPKARQAITFQYGYTPEDAEWMVGSQVDIQDVTPLVPFTMQVELDGKTFKVSHLPIN